MNNVHKPLAKKLLITFGLTAVASTGYIGTNNKYNR